MFSVLWMALVDYCLQSKISMGLYEGQLKCGCVEVTSTLDSPPKTILVKPCEQHKTKDQKEKQDGKSSETEKQPTK